MPHTTITLLQRLDKVTKKACYNNNDAQKVNKSHIWPFLRHTGKGERKRMESHMLELKFPMGNQGSFSRTSQVTALFPSHCSSPINHVLLFCRWIKTRLIKVLAKIPAAEK